MSNQSIITLVNENGDEKQVKVLYAIDGKELFNKDFLVVTSPEESDEDKELIFLSAIPVSNEGEFQIEIVNNPDEWNFVQSQFSNIVLEEGGEIESVITTEEK